MKYDYIKEMLEDVKNYIEENKDNESYDFNNREELESLLYDDLWIDDSVTGNGSGSYTFSTYQAEENISHNMDLLKEACQEFGSDPFELLENPEKADVTIRCYLLGQVISMALDEILNGKTKKPIKIVKYVEYFKNGELIEKAEILKDKSYNEEETKNRIRLEQLNYYYNSKSITVKETIEAIIETENGLKKLYKTIKPENGEVVSNV